MDIRITFIEDVLGTMPGSKEVAAEFVAGKLLDSLTAKQRRALFSTPEERKEFVGKLAKGESIDINAIPDLDENIVDKLEQELAAIETEGDIAKASTIFPRNTDGLPFLWSYQVRGFLKTACEATQMSDTHTKEQLKAVRLTPYLYKKTIDLLVFVGPRQIPFEFPSGVDPANLPFLERPLRAQTMRGERICLARSEIIPAGTRAHFSIKSLNKKLEPYLRQWLNYGKLHGFLQWRSGGYGRFTWEEIPSEATGQ